MCFCIQFCKNVWCIKVVGVYRMENTVIKLLKKAPNIVEFCCQLFVSHSSPKSFFLFFIHIFVRTQVMNNSLSFWPEIFSGETWHGLSLCFPKRAYQHQTRFTALCSILWWENYLLYERKKFFYFCKTYGFQSRLVPSDSFHSGLLAVIHIGYRVRDWFLWMVSNADLISKAYSVDSSQLKLSYREIMHVYL